MTSFDRVIRSQGFWLVVVLVLGLAWLLTMMSQFFPTPAKAAVANYVPTASITPVAGKVVTATVGITPTRTVTPTLVALVPTATNTVEPTRTRFPTAKPTDTTEPTRTPFPTAVPANTQPPPTRTPFPTALPTNTPVPPPATSTLVPVVVVPASSAAPLAQNPVVGSSIPTRVVLHLETATPDPRLGTPDDQALFIDQPGDCWLSFNSVADYAYGGAGAWAWQCIDVYLVPGTKIAHVKTRDHGLKYTGKLVPFAASQYYEVVSVSGKTFWLLKY